MSLFNNFAKKERNARGADDLHPIETTTPQGAVQRSYGKHWWTTGPNPTYKFGDQWVVSDRLLLDVQYAHVGNNFVLDFHAPELSDVQPTLIVATGLNGRSATRERVHPSGQQPELQRELFPAEQDGRRPRAQVRRLLARLEHHVHHAYRRIRHAALSDRVCRTTARSLATGCQADLTRDGYSVYDLLNYSAYVQDTFTHGRADAAARPALRLQPRPSAQAASVVANPLGGPWLPAINFPGADPGRRLQQLLAARRA